MNKQIITNVAVGVASAGLGAGVAHILTKKHFQKIADEEIESVKSRYSRLRKEGPWATPESAVEHLKKTLEAEKEEVDAEIKEYAQDLENLGYAPVSSEDMEDNTPEGAEPLKVGDKVGRYIIDDRPIETVEEPSEDHPYLIREDQYHEDFDGYEKQSLTFYEKDDTLSDEADRGVEDVEAMIGHDALTRFGEGSNDKDIVYVRNTKQRTDYEITRDARSYSQMVLGLDDTDEQPRVRKMRDHE